jgi:hypothetical protein
MKLIKKILISFFAAIGILSFPFFLLHFFGYNMGMTGSTESMKPYLKPYCLFIYKQFEPSIFDAFSNPNKIEENLIEMKKNEIKEGDIVIFKYKSEIPVIHRVIDFCENGVITKGDNNNGIDGCIPYYAISGKLVFKFC